jgi:hypothetical protein
MTAPRIKSLTARQAEKINSKSLRFILRGKPNPILLRSILLNSNNKLALSILINHFVNKAKKGDVRAKLLLNRLASEKFNKNVISRGQVLDKFGVFAKEGDSFGLRGLLVGAKDSDIINRDRALFGLCQLAIQGDGRVLSGLFVGVKDSSKTNFERALFGLITLANKGNSSAKKALKGLGY